jgi:hypothetical protein
MNRAEANGGQGLPGLAGALPWRKGGGPHAQDQIAELLRARLRGLFVGTKKNSKKRDIDPARREPAEALKAEFEGSMGKLGTRRERIRQTDELIDATVYRLYALTEEEIGIVEGNKA